MNQTDHAQVGFGGAEGVEPLHRSFAARPTTRRPLTIQIDRLRRQRSEIKKFAYFDGD